MTEEELLEQLAGLNKNNAQAQALLQQLKVLRSQPSTMTRRSSPGGAIFSGLAHTIDSGVQAFEDKRLSESLGKTEAERTEKRAQIIRDVLSGTAPPIQKPGSFSLEDAPAQQGQSLPSGIPAGRLGALLKGSGDGQLGEIGGFLIDQEKVNRGVAQKLAEYLRGRQDKAEDTASYRQWMEKQNELNRNSQERAASLSAGRTQANAIAAEDRADLRKREGSAREIEERSANAERALTQLETLVGESGTFETFGPHNAMLEGAITDFATDMAKLKDPTSVARESEVEMEKKALFSPGLKTRNATALDLIKNAKKKVQERRNEAYRVRGLSIPEGGGDAGKVRVTNGAETLEIDPSDLAAAVKDGYRPTK